MSRKVENAVTALSLLALTLFSINAISLAVCSQQEMFAGFGEP
jgi:hypothetical protein